MSLESQPQQPHDPAGGDKKIRLVCAALFLVHVVASWLTRSPGLGWGEDDSQYLTLAKELTHFGYRERWDVLAPLHARYPPVFPALLALVGVPAHWRLDALYLWVAVCSALAIVFFFDAVRRLFNFELALIVGLLVALNPMTVWDAGMLMSESAFKLFLAMSLWATTRENERPFFPVLAGGALIAAALTRSAGVVLVAGLLAYWLIQRRFRRALVYALAALCTVGPWLYWSWRAPEPETQRLYVADLVRIAPAKDTGQRDVLKLPISLVRRVPARVKQLATVMVPTALAFPTIPGTIADNVAWLGVLVVTACVGVLVLLNRWPGATALLAAYLSLVLTWVWAVERFLTPVVPILYLIMLLGVQRLLARWGPSISRRATYALTALLLVGCFVNGREMLGDRLRCDRARPAESPECYPEPDRIFLQMAAWVRDSIPSDAIVITNKPAAFYVHSGHRSVNQARALREDTTAFVPYLRSRGVTYAIVSPVGVLLSVYSKRVASTCRDFILVKEFPQASSVLRLRSPDEPGDDGASCRALEPWKRLVPRASEDDT